jgi:hypothetical protein
MQPDTTHFSRQMDRGMHDKNIEFTDERDYQRRERKWSFISNFFQRNTHPDRRSWKRRTTDRK